MIAAIVAIGSVGAARAQPERRPPPEPEATPPAPTDEVAALRDELARLAAELERQRADADARALADDQARVARADVARRLDQLEAELAAEREAARARAEAEPQAFAGAPGVIATAGRVRFALGMFVQVDTIVNDQASVDELDPTTREPLNQDRVLLRRGRLRIEVDSGVLGGVLELDASTVRGPAMRPQVAEVIVRVPWRRADLPELELFAGLTRIPFGLEVREPSRRRLFLEPGNAARALFPGNHDLGVGVRGAWRFLRLHVAAMNGEPAGARSFAGRDATSAKDVVGRLGLVVGRQPSRPGEVRAAARGLGVDVGISATTGDGLSPGVASTKDTLVWRDINEDGIVQATEIQVIPGQVATPSATFSRHAVGADVHVTAALGAAGELRVYGEVIRAQNLDRGLFPADPVRATRDLRELGATVAVAWDAPFGAQAGVRYDVYDPDEDAFEQQAGTVVPRDPVVSTLAIAVGWRLRGSGRILVEYDRETNPFGRDAGAEPTTRADDGVTVRVEATF